MSISMSRLPICGSRTLSSRRSIPSRWGTVQMAMVHLAMDHPPEFSGRVDDHLPDLVAGVEILRAMLGMALQALRRVLVDVCFHGAEMHMLIQERQLSMPPNEF